MWASPFIGGFKTAKVDRIPLHSGRKNQKWTKWGWIQRVTWETTRNRGGGKKKGVKGGKQMTVEHGCHWCDVHRQVGGWTEIFYSLETKGKWADQKGTSDSWQRNDFTKHFAHLSPYCRTETHFNQNGFLYALLGIWSKCCLLSQYIS